MADGRRVLIADDDAELRAVLRECVVEGGSEVLEAENGLEALWAIKHTRPDVVLLDLAMPRLGGLDTLPLIHEFDPSIRVIVVSGHATPEIAGRLAALGIPLLTKPVDLPALRVLIGNTNAESRGDRHPARAAAAPAATRRSTASEKERSGPAAPIRARVLLADDSTTDRRVAKLMLEKLGCRVDEAASGREAVEMLVMAPYDVVFIDCEMPDLDGYRASTEIRRRQRETVWRVPIVGMTAHPGPEQQPARLAAGMDATVGKPLRVAEVSAALDRWCRRTGDAAPPIADAERSPLDLEVFETLVELAGDGESSMLDELVGTFLEDARTRIVALHEAARGADPPALKAAAHALKGGSSGIGASGMAALCRELEALAAGAAMEEAGITIGRLEVEFERVRRELARRLRAG